LHDETIDLGTIDGCKGTTCAAASSVQPPAKTDSRLNSTRSGSLSNA
jgi:hypothetical protein